MGKIKASTLIETLVSTVLIILIFMISSLILNQLARQYFTLNTNNSNAMLKELKYRYLVEEIQVPYREETEKYILRLTKYDASQTDLKQVNVEVFDKRLDKSISERIPSK